MNPRLRRTLVYAFWTFFGIFIGLSIFLWHMEIPADSTETSKISATIADPELRMQLTVSVCSWAGALCCIAWYVLRKQDRGAAR